MSKKICIALLFSFILVNLHATAGRAILHRAFDLSSKSSLKVLMPNPFPPAPKESRILPHAETLILYRKITNDELNLRVETIRSAHRTIEIMETYIKNSEGIWGIAPDGFAAEVIEVPIVWLLELMFNPLSETEFNNAIYSTPVIAKYNGRNCYKVLVTLPKTVEFLHKITGETISEITQKKSMYMSERPFAYEFLIDCQKYLIISRKHYNAHGKTLFHIKFNQWETLSEDKNLFDTPANIQGKFIEQSFFASRILDKMIKARQVKTGINWSAKGIILWEWILQYGFIFCLIIAITAIIMIAIIKHRE